MNRDALPSGAAKASSQAFEMSIPTVCLVIFSSPVLVMRASMLMYPFRT